MSQRIVPKEYLGAFKAGHRKTSKEFISEGLAQQLLRNIQKNGCEESKRVLEWLTKFNNEYHKRVIKKGDPAALHKTDELRRDCYDLDNSRNRDIASTWYRTNQNEHSLAKNYTHKTEDNLIELLDLLKEQRLSIKN